jgi:hypothetical protein
MKTRYAKGYLRHCSLQVTHIILQQSPSFSIYICLDSQRPQLWVILMGCVINSVPPLHYNSGFRSVMSIRIEQTLVDMSKDWWVQWMLEDIYHKVLTVTTIIPECECVVLWYTYTLWQHHVPFVLNGTCLHPHTHTNRAEFRFKVSWFKNFLHFTFTFCGPSQNPIHLMYYFRLFQHLRHENLVPTNSGTLV